MFFWEEGSEKIIDDAIEKYEEHFDETFPLYEYIDMTKDKDYDFSLEGSKRFSEFIDKRIADNKPVVIPEGYEERLY